MLRRALLSFSFAVLASVGSPALASTASRPAEAAGRWLAAQQRSDGSIPAAGTRVDQAADAAASVAAAGETAAAARVLDQVGTAGPSGSTRGGQAGRAVMGIAGAGGDPRRLGGNDFVTHLQSFYEPATGRYDSNLYAHALALVGLKAAAAAIPDEAVRYIDLNQCRDGGFGHQPGCVQSADVDTTAMVIIAMAASGRDRSNPALSSARQWLLNAANSAGGFGDKPGAATNANSTGIALSSIAALGERATASPWARSGVNPHAALTKLQRSDGSFPYLAGGKSDGYATVQAIPGLLGLGLPLAPPETKSPGIATPGQTGNENGNENGPAGSSAPLAPGSTPTSSAGASALELGVDGSTSTDDRTATAPTAAQPGRDDGKSRAGSSPLVVIAAALMLVGAGTGALMVRRRLLAPR